MFRFLVSLMGVGAVAIPMFTGRVAVHPGAKALFYDPASGQASISPVPPSPATGLTPVQTFGTAFVGVHYWFENDRGIKFADPGGAGLGAKVRMHLRGNTQAFLTVWMSDSTRTSVELTPRSAAGPEGRWTGYRLARDVDYVIAGEFEVKPLEQATRIAFLLARSQTEQVDSFSGCQEKLQRIAGRTTSDSDSMLVREVDRTTPGQVGTYVVHRGGAQTGEEFAIAPTQGKEPSLKFSVASGVKQPGDYDWVKDLTIEKAVELAGGLAETSEGRATLDGAKITRLVNGTKETIRGKPATPVLPDDKIQIPVPLSRAPALPK